MLSQFHPPLNLTTHHKNIHLNNIHPFLFDLPSDPFLRDFTIKILCALLPNLTTFPAHHSIPDFIILRMLDELHKPRRASLCNTLYYLPTSSFLGPNIFVSNMFSYACNLCSSFKTEYHVSGPYKTSCNVIMFHKKLDLLSPTTN
jgi:hypothetical protein